MKYSINILIYVVIFVMTWTVCLWGNDFPTAYHPDETGKVLQVLGQLPRNHLHPPLLLDISKLVHEVSGKDDSLPHVVAAGRWVSATAGALAAVMLAMSAHLLVGRLAGILVGLMVGLCPAITIFSHYMKEDALLILGIASVLLAATWYCIKPRTWSACLLAVACVFVMLAKYVGIVAMLCGIVIWLVHLKQCPRQQRLKQLVGFGLSLVLAFLVLGYHWWIDAAQALKGLAEEWNHVNTGHFDLAYTTLGNIQYYAGHVASMLSYWLLLPAILSIYRLSRSKHQPLRIMSFGVLACIVIYSLMLLLSRFATARYAIPVVVLMTWLAGVFLGHWLTNVKRVKHRTLLGASVFLLVVGTMGFRAYQVIYQFDHDGRPAMNQWVKTNLDADAYVVEDMYCAMPDQRNPKMVELYGRWEPKIRMARYAAVFGNLEKLHAKGVTHVAVCNYSYDRFINAPGLKPKADDARALARVKHCRQFYSQLFEQYPIVWSHQPRYNLPGLTSPTLYIFQLNQGKASEEAQ